MSASLPTDENSKRPAEPVAALRRFIQKREPEQVETEHCELCSEVIPADHRHLLNLSNRALVCACQACSLLFSEEGASGGTYRLIPRRYLALADFEMTDQQWEELLIPVNIAFLFYNSDSKQVMAFYPSPAGATESLLDLEGWELLVTHNPILEDLRPDVEALLINRVKNAREHYIVPIDTCYELVGLIRISWRGLSGGTETWEAIGDFFENVQAKSKLVRREHDAQSEL